MAWGHLRRVKPAGEYFERQKARENSERRSPLTPRLVWERYLFDWICDSARSRIQPDVQSEALVHIDNLVHFRDRYREYAVARMAELDPSGRLVEMALVYAMCRGYADVRDWALNRLLSRRRPLLPLADVLAVPIAYFAALHS
jgi:hypothetical protein